MFGIGKKKRQQTVIIQNVPSTTSVSVVWTKDFIQSGNFRGYKRIKLRHNGDSACAATIDAYRKVQFNFADRPITLKCVRAVESGETYHHIDVSVDGYLIGQVANYSDKNLSMLMDYEYDAVYLMVDEKYHADGTVMGQNVYLFVHYVGEEPE